jgi:hypothetical protein
MIAAGVFVADPADRVPPGTPPGRPDTVSWHSGLHFLAAWLALFAWPEQDLVTLAYAVAALHGLGWVSLVAAHLRTGLPATQG